MRRTHSATRYIGSIRRPCIHRLCNRNVRIRRCCCRSRSSCSNSSKSDASSSFTTNAGGATPGFSLRAIELVFGCPAVCWSPDLFFAFESDDGNPALPDLACTQQVGDEVSMRKLPTAHACDKGSLYNGNQRHNARYAKLITYLFSTSGAKVYPCVLVKRGRGFS